MIENLLIKKRNYLSIRSLEISTEKTTKADITDYMKKFLDSGKTIGDVNTFFTKDYSERIEKDAQTKIQYDRFINILKRYVKDYDINEDSIHSEGCNYRVDIKFPTKIELIEDKYYRVFLTSCENGLKVENITYIDDMDDISFLKSLKCDMIMKDDSIGFVELVKESIRYKVKISGTLNKLEEYKGKKLGLHIHTQGDIEDDCKKCGSHYNPTYQFHGDVSGERHLGDLGNIIVDMDGTSNFVIYITSFPLPNDVLLHKFIGRSIVLHDQEDDLGKGATTESSRTGTSGKRIACGILGGIYE
jgi:Cu/Zn superoxide dismutase